MNRSHPSWLRHNKNVTVLHRPNTELKTLQDTFLMIIYLLSSRHNNRKGNSHFYALIDYSLRLRMLIFIKRCSSFVRVSHRSNTSLWSSEIFPELLLSPFSKNSDKLIPSPLQILFSVIKVGIVFFLTIADKADCEIPVKAESWYLLILFCLQSSSIFPE